MVRVFYTLICALLLASTAPVFAQRNYEVEEPKLKARTVKPKRPQGSQVAQTRGNGVLFVLTDPDVAQVAIKSRGNTVKQGLSKDGEFRVELPPGLYDVEVSSQNYKTFTSKATVRPVDTRPVDAELLPTVGSIFIGFGNVDANAKVLLNGKEPQDVIKRGENQLEINNVPEGTHSLRISHPTIVTWEKKVIVGAGAETKVTPRFEAAVANLIIKSEPGADVYVNEIYKGRVADNGELNVDKLPPGEHKILVSKDKFQTVTLPRKRLAIGTETLEVKLKRTVFSGPFDDQFIGDYAQWDVPKNWQVPKGMVVRAASGVGLLRDLVYADFKATVDVTFSNSKGAAWVIRARDKQNYYLFQLLRRASGSGGTFHSYIVENGQIRQLRAPEVLALNLSKLDKEKDASFQIFIEAVGPSIQHFIERTDTPQAEGRRPLSVLTDNTFSSGSLGFTSKDGEEFVVKYINVAPTK